MISSVPCCSSDRGGSYFNSDHLHRHCPVCQRAYQQLCGDSDRRPHNTIQHLTSQQFGLSQLELLFSQGTSSFQVSKLLQLS